MQPGSRGRKIAQFRLSPFPRATHNLLKLFRYRNGKGPQEAPKTRLRRNRRAPSRNLAVRVGFFRMREHSRRDSFAAIIAMVRID